ncbi:MAG: phosphoglycerate mutase (2,3-diphosphoglycerate-independent) [Clostridiales bacterium]|nr:phosphoglycerate mutase (2,3-diphosphoglycerate-independent) [Clostridiales bacterium]
MNKGIMIILDGYGEGESSPFNAVKNANTPTLDKVKENGFSLIKTSGESVGLFPLDMGGSEVGHMTLGAGRVVPTTAKLISDEIKSKNFEKNKNLIKILKKLEKCGSNLHLVGLMSDKRIHSDINHCVELVKIASKYAKNVFIHFITDGRDCGIYDSLKYLKFLKKEIKSIENCEIASVGGRDFAMDRDKNMDKIETAFNAMFSNEKKIKNVENYIKKQHELGFTDQFIQPARVETKGDSSFNKNDLVFFFNFREDRLRQMVDFVQSKSMCVAAMSNVGGSKGVVLYPNKNVKNTLSEHLSKLGIKHVKISESTKYAHVTYFFNGGQEAPFEMEERVHIKTKSTEDFALTPKMRAKEITSETIKHIKKNYGAIIVNFSNPDMIGHTGNYEKTKIAIEYLDKCVKKILKCAKKNDYFVMLTADHGNSEQMRTENNQPHMAHTLNDVFCSVVSQNNVVLKEKGELSDIAPTFLDLMRVKANKSFTGHSLIINSVDKTKDKE